MLRRERRRGSLAALHGLQQRPKPVLAELGRDVHHRHPEELIARITKLLDRALVHMIEAQGLGVEDEDAVTGGIQDLSHPAKLRFGFDPLADVAHHRHDP